LLPSPLGRPRQLGIRARASSLPAPLRGGRPAFDVLLREAHRRNLRVVLDGVFNHASRGFFQFNDILENEAASPYLDWFKVNSFPMNAYWGKPGYTAWADLAALPEFNHANPQVRRYIMDVARYWVEQGIDGWRLDVPFCFGDDAFWQEFRAVVKTANPEAYITGEIPWDATRWMQGDQFDGVMNYLLTYACWGFFGGGNLDWDLIGHWAREDHGGLWIKPGAEAFAASVTNLLERYPTPNVRAQLNLLDSHDTARVISIFKGDKAAFKLAETFIFTYPGAPCIYYGNEIGLEGGRDPDCRRAFPWDERRWDRDLRGYLQKLAAIRAAHPALRDGGFKVLHAAGDAVVYLRSLGAERVVVALNRGQGSAALTLDLSAELEAACTLRELLTGGE
ncbi:MAG: alpha-amylase, partial [Actinobacteria bacterium]